MRVHFTVKSDRKKRRFQLSAKSIENRIKRELVKQASKPLVAGVKMNLNNLTQNKAKDKLKITSEKDLARGWVTIKAKVSMPSIGVTDKRVSKQESARQESWLRGDKVVVEIPSGFLYNIFQSSIRSGDPVSETFIDSFRDNPQVRNQLSNIKQARTKVMQRIRKQLVDAIKLTLRKHKPYREKVRKVLNAVGKEISLADI